MSEVLRRQDATAKASGSRDSGAGGGESTALAVGGVAALLVGACCVGPLVLVAIGLGGAWLSNLTALEPYRPIFIAIALVSLAFAWRRIYRSANECKPGETCSVPAIKKSYKIGFWMVAAVLVVMFGFPYVAPFFL
jgi:mercuric ion transport protein